MDAELWDLTMNVNGSDTGQSAAPAPALSPEFLGVSTEAGLDKIRTRLLDLTNRNRLLNFRHTVSSSLRFVDANLNAVFGTLLDGEKLEFLPVPEPTVEPGPDMTNVLGTHAKPPAADYAKHLGWATSYDLEPGSEDEGATVLACCCCCQAYPASTIGIIGELDRLAE